MMELKWFSRKHVWLRHTLAGFIGLIHTAYVHDVLLELPFDVREELHDIENRVNGLHAKLACNYERHKSEFMERRERWLKSEATILRLNERKENA